MGIDTVVRGPNGEVVSSLGDPHEFLGWALDMCKAVPLTGLREIDPYGDTQFSVDLLAPLLTELDLLAQSMTADQFTGVRDEYSTHHAKQVSASAHEQHERYLERVRLDDVREHICALAHLIRVAKELETGHIVEFIGD